MGRRHRADGRLVADEPGYRRFMPALMPSRNGSAVYFDQQLRVDGTERALAALRREHPELRPTLFHVVVWALGRMFELHPRVNRFVAGGRLYQRDGITIVFTAKSALTEDGTLLEVKHRHEPGTTLVDTVRAVEAEVAAARAGAGGLADRELALFLHLPPLLRRGIVQAASVADALGVLPRTFVDGDPFFASAFVTNLGSVGLDAAFHHLYEYGTIPVFGTLGRVHDAPGVDDGVVVATRVASMRFTFDERVEDGMYAAHALDDLRALVEHPEVASSRPSRASGPFSAPC